MGIPDIVLARVIPAAANPSHNVISDANTKPTEKALEHPSRSCVRSKRLDTLFVMLSATANRSGLANVLKTYNPA